VIFQCVDAIDTVKLSSTRRSSDAITCLQRRLDAAATAIATLHDDNTLLRQELIQTGATVLPLHRHRDPVPTPRASTHLQQVHIPGR
jgi:hypothetical protein